MKILRPTALGIGLFCLLVLAPSGLYPSLENGDDWNLLRLLGQLRRTQQAMADLSAQDKVLLTCLDLKRALADDLAAGRLTLSEAAERLRGQPFFSEAGMARLRRLYPAPTDEACLGRHLIVFTRSALRDGPDTDAVVARLEAQWLALAHRRAPFRYRDENPHIPVVLRCATAE